MEEAQNTLTKKDWDNFQSFRFEMNHAPVEMIAAISENMWQREADLKGGKYQQEYEKIPEGTRKKIHGAWAKMSLEGLNGVFEWMESQISQGLICLTQTDELPDGQPGNPDTQIHFQTEDNPHRAQ